MLGCFRGGTVVQSLASHDKFDAIRELIHKAPIFAGLGCREELEEAVVQREKILSTGLGRGVAVAHGTTEMISDIIIALGISEAGIDFDSFDKAPVHLLFVITNPPGRQMERLPKGIGIMLDDVVAGVYTVVILHLCRWWLGG